jgi:hypothetical protein
MNPRHTAALALVGWYLMMPPMAADLDGSCAAQDPETSVSDIFVALIARKWPSEINMIRCDSLRHEVRYDAPVSAWQQVDSFETLASCQAEYESNQKPYGNQTALTRGAAEMEFLDEGKSHPSEDELKTRARTIDGAVQAQVSGEKCIATDDPRLRQK